MSVNKETGIKYMIFCGNCGAKIPDNVKFCPKCGAKVSDFSAPKNDEKQPTANPSASNQAVPNQQAAPFQQPTQPMNGTQQNQSSNAKSFLQNPKIKEHKTLIIIALIVIVVGGFMFSQTAKYRDMTMSSSSKSEYISSWMTTNDDDIDVTATVENNRVILKAKEEGKLIDFLDETNYAKSELTFLRTSIEKTSSEANREWGPNYIVEVQDESGNTVVTAQNGILKTDHLLEA